MQVTARRGILARIDIERTAQRNGAVGCIGLVRLHVEHNQTTRLSCRAHPAPLLPREISGTLASTRVADLDTRRDAPDRYGSNLEAGFPTQARGFDRGSHRAASARAQFSSRWAILAPSAV